MGVGTAWFIADASEAQDVLSGETDQPSIDLEDIGELELLSLGEILGTPYKPALVLETEDGVVIQPDGPFLRALAAVPDSDLQRLADMWRTRSEHLAASGTDEIESALRAIVTFSRQASNGPGILAIPLF